MKCILRQSIRVAKTSGPSSVLRNGFTLVELMVVIAVIGLVVALSLPAVQAAREIARQSQCKNNFRQIALAIQQYHDGCLTFPISMGPWPGESSDPNPVMSTGLNGKGWIVSILPQLDQGPLFEQMSLGFPGNFISGEGIKAVAVREAMKTQLPVLQCPSDWSVRQLSTKQWEWNDIPVALTSYKGVIGDTKIGGIMSIHKGSMPDCHMFGRCNGLFFRVTYREPQSMRNVSDGTSSTLLIGEDVPEYNNHSAAFYANSDYASCYAPINFFTDPPIPDDWANVTSFRSRHRSGAHFALADGSVRFFSQQIEHSLYRALSTKAGGETASVP